MDPPCSRPGSSLWYLQGWLSSKLWRWCWWLSPAPAAAVSASGALRHTPGSFMPHIRTCDITRSANTVQAHSRPTWDPLALCEVWAWSVGLGVVLKHQQSLGTQLHRRGWVQSCCKSDHKTTTWISIKMWAICSPVQLSQTQIKPEANLKEKFNDDLHYKDYI